MKTELASAAPEPTEQQIQHAAYLLWVEAGRPEGREVEHWHTAQETLRHHGAPPAAEAKRRRSRSESHLAL